MLTAAITLDRLPPAQTAAHPAPPAATIESQTTFNETAYYDYWSKVLGVDMRQRDHRSWYIDHPLTPEEQEAFVQRAEADVAAGRVFTTKEILAQWRDYLGHDW